LAPVAAVEVASAAAIAAAGSAKLALALGFEECMAEFNGEALGGESGIAAC
jgi:hypothetical protein